MKTLLMDHLTTIISSSSLHLKSQTPTSTLLHLLRRFLLLSLRLLLLLLSLLVSSPPFRPGLGPNSLPPSPDPTTSSSAERALSHVLSVVARVPVASRKYELVRSLADTILADNLRLSSPYLSSLNRHALSSAFSRTLRRLELSVTSTRAEWSSSVDLILGAVRSGVKRLVAESAEAEGVEIAGERTSAEKMAAEAIWLAGRMAECGAVEEAVKRWGEAAVLARVALSAEPRLQVAFVRVSAFLFKHANAKQFGRKGVSEEEEEECVISRYRMAMLTSWLPLLCRASNGTDAPILSSGERADMVKVLEEMIEKLSWDQQEEVLALWLHHFTSCPDSDWPNLQSCYTRWYSESRDLLLLK